MNIDEQVESHVRGAFTAAIARDGDGIVNALVGLSPEGSGQALRLALYVCGVIVNDVADADTPTDVEIRALADQIVEAERSWVQLDRNTVATFLRLASAGDATFSALDEADLVGLSFTCGGHLLAAFRLEDQPWWDYLDTIWASLEAAPDPHAVTEPGESVNSA